MIELYLTDGPETRVVQEIKEWTWVKLTAPTDDEIQRVAADLPGLDKDDLMAAIDPEEKTRLVHEDSYSLILVDVPTRAVRHDIETYATIPLGIVLMPRNVITICSEDTQVLTPFHAGRVRGFSTRMRISFIYQILLRTSLLYQQALTEVDRKRKEFEERIANMTGEHDLLSLHELESTLVYFATSLRGNGGVLARLAHSERVKPGPEDEDLLEDAIVENQQAVEMAQIYHDIIDGTRDLMTSVMDSRLNNVMQRLTSITLILSIPTIISGLYGMNVDLHWMPLALTPHGFGIICFGTSVICVIMAIWLVRQGWM
ncbi:MAG: magnesium transporter CorA family protein [Coriobacteriales bacterium]|nr:magnesium transporter CorA family protein [Coriobacteriales bacterium]MDO5708493.1 magnesium transporter CorA family protein [Coriobacteriales bacterium]